MYKELEMDDRKPTVNTDEDDEIAKVGKIDTSDFFMMLGGVGFLGIVILGVFILLLV